MLPAESTPLTRYSIPVVPLTGNDAIVCAGVVAVVVTVPDVTVVLPMITLPVTLAVVRFPDVAETLPPLILPVTASDVSVPTDVMFG